VLLINSILVIRRGEFISEIIIRALMPNIFNIITRFFKISYIIILIANIKGIRGHFKT
jgi:hypothetical protein